MISLEHKTILVKTSTDGKHGLFSETLIEKYLDWFGWFYIMNRYLFKYALWAPIRNKSKRTCKKVRFRSKQPKSLLSSEIVHLCSICNPGGKHAQPCVYPLKPAEEILKESAVICENMNSSVIDEHRCEIILQAYCSARWSCLGRAPSWGLESESDGRTEEGLAAGISDVESGHR